jgi:hypothetical protein
VSANYYRSRLEGKRRQRATAEKKAAEFRTREADKRAAAGRAHASAAKASSASLAGQRSREATRLESQANAAGKDAAQWQMRAASYLKDEASLQENLARVERAEMLETQRRAMRDERRAEMQVIADRAILQSRLDYTDSLVQTALRELRAPRPERLRVLMLAASSEGDLRVGREQKRIRVAVERAVHRDLVELDVRTSASTSDLLDGIVRFRPHVVHFSGHGNDDLIVFEDEVDEPHEGVVVSAEAFARAVAATDEPPLLILLNSCNSASQIDRLVENVAPFAIGMSDEIEDGDAITYAAQFYATVANGHSIQSAHASGQAALELAGLAGADLPRLAHAPDVDPATAYLVVAPA